MAISGYGGNVKVGTTPVIVAEIGKWELQVESNMQETPVFNAGGWMNHVAGIKKWSGTFEGFFNTTDTTGQKVVWDAIENGIKVTLELYVDATHKYSGQAFISAWNVETNAEDTVALSIDFTGDGPLTEPVYA